MEPAPDNSILLDHCPNNNYENGYPICIITHEEIKNLNDVIKINGKCYNKKAFNNYLAVTELNIINSVRDEKFNNINEAITQSFTSISDKDDHVKIWDPQRKVIGGEDLQYFFFNPVVVGGKSKKNFRKAFTKKKKKNKNKNKKTSFQSRKKRNNKYK